MRTPRCGFPAGQFAGFANPSVTRTWQDDDGDFNPDCELTIPTAQGTQTAPGGVADGIDFCGAISNPLFGSNQFVGANFDPGVASGWGKRPSDWSFSVSVQQEIFPRVNRGRLPPPVVHDVHHRRHGDRQPRRRARGSHHFSMTAPTDPRLPNGGGHQVEGLLNLTPAAFSRVQNLLIKSTKDVGDDTRVFNGVDVTFNVRNVKGVLLRRHEHRQDGQRLVRHPRGRAFALNPYCRVESPFQTSFNGLVTYTIPKFDVLLSGVYRDRVILNGTPNNASTDQLGGSLPATSRSPQPTQPGRRSRSRSAARSPVDRSA